MISCTWLRHALLATVLAVSVAVGIGGFHATQALPTHSHQIGADGDPGVPPPPS